MRRVSIFAAFCILIGGAWGEDIPYERTVCLEPMRVGLRQRVVERTRLYAETITHYAHFQNFLHYWIDRPLFSNRELRPDLVKKFQYDTKESFLISQRDALRAGLDGLATFGNFSSRLASFKEHASWVEESGLAGFSWLPVVLYGESGMNGRPGTQKFVDFIRYAQSTPVTPEIKGCKLIATYNTRRYSIDAHRAFCRDLREQVGNDRYLLVGDYPNRDISELRQAFHRNGGLSLPEVRKLEKMTTDLLNVFDGLDLNVYEHAYVRTSDGPYTSAIDMAFFDQCIKPVIQEVYSRPEYQGKLFGQYIIQGYINCHSGMNHGEFGTESLRKMMRSAAALNPDFAVFFEWNEQNENTMFQPTLYSGQTIGRLVKWYSDFINGRANSVYGDDDSSIPDIVLSHRVVFKPGEKVRFELLNIPCGETVPDHVIQLALTDESGKRLLTFPQERLASDRLAAVTYAVPGEAFAVGSVLRPVLKVDGRIYCGFHPIRSSATVCRNYKEVRQSLRDALLARSADLKVEQISKGCYRCAANVAFDEEIASLELVCNEDEIAAFDPSGEYDTEQYDILQLALSAAPGKDGGGQIKLSFSNANGVEMSQDWKANANPGAIKRIDKDAVLLNTAWWTQPSAYFLKFPKGSLSAGSKVGIKVLSGKHIEGREVEVPLDVVLVRGAWAAEIAPATGLRVDVARVDNLPDLPKAPNVRTVQWNCSVRTSELNPVFHLRAIAKSGRTWRSAPVRPLSSSGRSIALPIYSEWLRRWTSVSVPADQVVEHDYIFTPDFGDLLACEDIRYRGTLGGGYAGNEPMRNAGLLKDIPDCALAPKWIKEDGRWMLRFDGENDVVSFPIETMPLGAFSLAMEIRPESCPTNMVVFRHAAYDRGSLALFIANGELYAMWPTRFYNWLDHEGSTLRYQTGLKVDFDAWNEITVDYDGATLSFCVNGVRKSYPLSDRGYVFKPSIFGGHLRRDDMSPPGPLTWFRGDLRKLTIRHGPK